MTIEPTYTRYIFMPDRKSREYDDAYPWLRSNIDHANVIEVGWADVTGISESGLLDKINEENDSMLGHYEDSWIHDPSILRTVIHWMENREHSLSELETRILVLLRKALKENTYVYFAL